MCESGMGGGVWVCESGMGEECGCVRVGSGDGRGVSVPD